MERKADFPLFNPVDFNLPEGVTHICAGGETAVLHRHQTAVATYFSDKANGMPGRTAQEEKLQLVRRQIAASWQVQPRDIGFVSNVAEGMSMLIESIHWRPGDNVCVYANEYPSLVSTLSLQKQKMELRLAQSIVPQEMARHIDNRTRLIAVSYISYLNGERADLMKLRELADAVGAMLVVDYTQAAGYLPINADIADFAFSACYKWLLGVTGTAIAYWNSRRRPDWRPLSAGWHSISIGTKRPDYLGELTLHQDALCFTRGNPSHISLYVLSSALDYLSAFDMHRVEAHIRQLTVPLLAALVDHSISTSTPAEPHRHGASVCIDTPHNAEVVALLREEKIFAWGGRGRVRFSFHGYNTLADVAHLIEVLPRIKELCVNS
ncbi:aminotransferase class V-fold PLP-dependent enzyme [Sodalis sp. dw_96]|uniref:aminotransferase class V-fold PLP-dependent enzyme n=1 Tax=Sodalis sp. dw_96 TaxID=2719794 RepID=UPI001BD33A28|nr:aminotransferase class V-fold PLP-dependent enzyme [Sodalis sp. dw_96]